VWGRDSVGAAGWLRFGTGEPVERVPQATRVVGLHDTNNDGEPELLYFQGESLVVHRR